MITKWLHIGHFGGNQWILEIWRAINDAVREGLCPEIDQELRELGIHISTRLNMLPVIIGRIDSGWKSLYKDKKVQNYTEDNIYEKDKEAYAIQIKGNLINPLLVDIDSFFFEINSCCDLMLRFFKGIYRHRKIVFKKKSSIVLKELLVNNGQSTIWFQLLDKNRNLFSHKRTPYIAIDISSDKADLIIMNKNLKSFDDPTTFIKLSEMKTIIKGFSEAIMILKKHIIGIYHK